MLSFHVKFVQTDRWTDRHGGIIMPEESVVKHLQFTIQQYFRTVYSQKVCRQHIQMVRFVFYRLENIVVKEKMLVTSIFSFYHNVLKYNIVWSRVKDRKATFAFLWLSTIHELF